MDQQQQDERVEVSSSKRQRAGCDVYPERKQAKCLKEQELDQEHELGKENKQQELLFQRFCCACNVSLDKSRHFINIAGQSHRWHPECFKCNVCKQPLDMETTCHIYRNKVVCRDDYAKLRRENSTKCSRCRWMISASDWVRKAGDFVYHLACFSCDICMRQLSTGEQFTLSVQGKGEARLLCRLHFAIDQPTTEIDHLANGEPANQSSTHCSTSNDPHSISVDTKASTSTAATAATTRLLPVTIFDTYACGQTQTNHKFQPHASNQEHHYLQLLASTSTNCPDQTQLLESANDVELDSHLAGEHRQALSSEHNLGGNLQQTARSSSNGSSSSSALGSMPSAKSKRVRTTFTEDQLSILQTHFQIDSNPDGQDLERIATITGLSKRVTQVWFQNSRARQKKYLIKRKPSGALISVSTSAIGLAGVAELQAQFAAAGQHDESQAQANPHQQQQRGQLLEDEKFAASHGDRNQQKWPSDRSDLSSTDGCAALNEIDEDDSRSVSQDNLIVSEDSNN